MSFQGRDELQNPRVLGYNLRQTKEPWVSTNGEENYDWKLSKLLMISCTYYSNFACQIHGLGVVQDIGVVRGQWAGWRRGDRIQCEREWRGDYIYFLNINTIKK